MKNMILTCSLGLLLNSSYALAMEVDFSGTYVINSATNVQEATFGNISTVDNNGIPSTQTLKLSYNNELGRFFVYDALPQVVDAQLLQAQLQGSVWKGDYDTNNNYYLTTITFISVENGFVGAQVIHDTGSPDNDNFLRAQLAGTLYSEYSILNKDEEAEWITEADYNARVIAIHEANAEALAEAEAAAIEDEEFFDPASVELEVIPTILAIRHQVRLKRVLGLEYRHASAQWGSANEYRFTIENGVLNGVVGTPRDSYGSNDGMTGNGALNLIPAALYDAEELPSGELE